MDFKTYYHQKLAEDLTQEAPLDTDAPAQQTQAQAQAANQEKPVASDDPDDAKIPTSPLASIVKNYLAKDPKMKVALAMLAKDIGDAIWHYSALELCKKEDFDSVDDWKKYKADIRNKVAETYNKTMIELFRNIGIYVNNQANTAAIK